MGCTGSGDGVPRTIADGLRAIDCDSAFAIEQAFGRFFGPGGALGTALTLLLTLYVAFLAIRLLTGRGNLTLGNLTPRMLTLGLILTFATSWVAYQAVVINLALGGPDQVARLLAGSQGSATMIFADRLDTIFDAIATSAANAAPPQAGPVTAPPPATPADLLWVAALMLLLGTVGILLVARIALAAMLALGPIFIVLALFGGTRGLFEGWLKAVVLFALTPLFAVLLGSGTIALVGPMVDDLAGIGREPDMRLAVTIFLGASVHVALMAMALKAGSSIVAGWRLPWSRDRADRTSGRTDGWTSTSTPSTLSSFPPAPASTERPAGDERIQTLVAGLSRPMAYVGMTDGRPQLRHASAPWADTVSASPPRPERRMIGASETRHRAPPERKQG